MRRVCIVLLSMFAVLAAVPRAAGGQAQPANPLECGIPPVSSQCEVQLGAKDTAVLVVVKPPMAATGVEEVTVISDRCCVDSTRVRRDANGLVRIRWSSATPPEKAVRLFVLVPSASGVPQQGVVTLLPAAVGQVSEILLTRSSVRTHYVWVQGTYIPATVDVEVASVGNRVVADRAECEKIRFTFQPTVEGKATPDSGRARWIPEAQGSAGSCRAQTRWKLGDASVQQMDLTLSGDGLRASRLRLVGYGRQEPRVMGGLGRFRHIVRDTEVQCTGAADHPQCAALDSFPQKVSTTVRGNGLEPYGAVEFSLLFMSHFRGALPEFVFRRVRLVGGTTLKHPEKNPFAGIALMPLVHTSLEESPFQLTIGSTLSGRKYFFYGVSVDAAIITNPLLGIFGLGN